MHDHRFSNDRIWTAQIKFPFPLEVPLAGSISFNIAEIAGVPLRPRRPVVVLMRRIEMRACRHRIRRRAIAFLVNVKPMLAWRQILYVRDHLHFVSHFGECDRASDATAGLRLQVCGRPRNVLRVRESCENPERAQENNYCFHGETLRRFWTR